YVFNNPLNFIDPDGHQAKAANVSQQMATLLTEFIHAMESLGFDVTATLKEDGTVVITITRTETHDVGEVGPQISVTTSRSFMMEVKFAAGNTFLTAGGNHYVSYHGAPLKEMNDFQWNSALKVSEDLIDNRSTVEGMEALYAKIARDQKIIEHTV